jgi:O-antigen/teichoic acid export membrane protein
MLRNIGANSIGALCNAALPLLTLPIYLHALGVEHWGLISFVTLFVSILSILDMGFSQALVREFASLTLSSRQQEDQASVNLLLSYERIYAGFAFVLGLGILPFVGVIATGWLDLGSLPKETGVFTIYCACAMFVAQFPGSIYRTVLIARQEQVKLNKIQVGFLLLRHAGSTALMLYRPNIELYLVWQIACTALETILTAVQAWKEMPGTRRQARWDSAAVGSTARFSGVMAASALLGAATGMVDKFYIAAKLPIADLGYYGIASSVAFGLVRLSYPIFTAVMPRLAQLQGSERKILHINRQLLLIVTMGLLCFATAYLLWGRQMLLWWLNSESTVGSILVILNLLLIAGALNIFYNIGYTSWVAAGKGSRIFVINLASFFVALIVTPLTIDRFGIVGAGAALVFMNSIGALSSLAWIFHGSMSYYRSIKTQENPC